MSAATGDRGSCVTWSDGGLSLPAILPTQLTEEPGRLALTHGAGSGKALRVAGETLPTEPGPAFRIPAQTVRPSSWKPNI